MPPIIQKRISRGAGLSGELNVRNQPSVTSAVSQQRGVITYNPFEGASQVGANTAQRLNMMGQQVAGYFNFGAKVLGQMDAMEYQKENALAEIAHREDIADIEYENKIKKNKEALNQANKRQERTESNRLLAQQEQRRVELLQRQGAADAATGVEPQDETIAYMESYIGVKASIAGQQIGMDLKNNIIPKLTLSDDPADIVAQRIAKETQGMDPLFITHFADAVNKSVNPSIDSQITALHGKHRKETLTDVADRITLDVTNNGLKEVLNPANFEKYVADLRGILGPTVTDGAIKSQVFTTILNTFKINNDDGAMSGFLQLLATDPKFGNGEKTFQELYPREFAQIAEDGKKITNAKFNLRAEGLATKIEEARTTYNLEPSPENLQTLLGLMYNPINKDYLSNKALRSALNMGDNTIDTLRKNNVAFNNIDEAYKNNTIPNQKDVTKFVESSNPIAMIKQNGNLSSFLFMNSKTPALNKNLGKALVQENSTIDKDDQPNDAMQLSMSSFMVIRQAEQVYGMTDADIKEKIGVAAYEVYDYMRDQPEANIANSFITGRDFVLGSNYLNKIAATRNEQVESAINNAVYGGRREGRSLNQAIGKYLNKEFGETSYIDPAIEEQYVHDLKRYVIRNNVDMEDRSAVKDALEAVSKQYALTHIPIRDDEEKFVLVAKGSLSEKQLQNFSTRTDSTGKARNSLVEAPDQFKKLVNPTTVRANVSPFGIGPTIVKKSKTPTLPFLKAVMDGIRFGDVTDDYSRANGSIPLRDKNGVIAILGAGMPPIEFGDGQSLTIVTDDAKEVGAELGDPKKVMQEGGVITISDFKEQFNDIGGVYGFELLERPNGFFTIEYAGTVPSEQQISNAIALTQKQQEEKMLAERAAKDLGGFQSEVGKRLQASFYGVDPNSPNRDAEVIAAKNAYDIGKQTTQDKWNNFDISKLLVTPEDPQPIVGQSTLQALAQGEEIMQAEKETEEMRNIFSGLINVMKQTQQVRPSLDITVRNIIPEKIENAKQFREVINQLLLEESKYLKAGLPNERTDMAIDETSYINVRKDLIVSGEGYRQYAYKDTSDIPTIGIGFNLKDPLVKKTLTHMLGIANYKYLLEDADKEHDADKQIKLTDAQIDHVFEAMIVEKEAAVTEWYKDVDLTPIQRAIIVDLTWQGHNKFVGPKTQFFKAVKENRWTDAIDEIRFRSNKNKVAGIENRNNHRADMLKNTLDFTL